MRSFKIRFLILAAMAFVIFLFCSKNSMNVIEEKIPSQWNDGGLFSKHYNLAYNVMKTMTLDEKIGQILLVRLPSSNVEKVIDKYKIGGFVFYHKDISKHSKKSLSDLVKEYNNEADLPLIIAIDEEGGSVVRLSNNKSFRSEPFKSPQRIFEESGYEGIVNTTKEMCDLLGGIGFNLNLAPVADISVNPKDYIYHRSFGKPAKETAEFVNCIIKTSQGSKVSFAMKHFPGYGSNHDTHKGMVVDNRSLDEIKSKKQEAEMVRRSRMAVQMQEEKLAVIDAELKILERKANSIRKSNMKEFESILTRQQKRTLKEMKKEGRQRYHSQHPQVKPHFSYPKPIAK